MGFPCLPCILISTAHNHIHPCTPVRRFDDGFPNLFVEGAEGIRNSRVAFLASFHNPSVIFEQISVIYALPRLFVGSFTLVLPFFPTGTLERVRHPGTLLRRACGERPSSRCPLLDCQLSPLLLFLLP